ncbi:hypothetical protein [Pedobacter jejuensis]|uniref:RagB/SusD family nutrient uptake outer membrane protein n=1 Tax=Pedobacter jejuensis TaxID=1268550 RepID=A0A3N0BVH5_9SPHI|nr:hypothetical protein [Pedobacter jejuensis]RNL53411.1 hypothetical protein D7004_10035 [Pedobacter jejuensis]
MKKLSNVSLLILGAASFFACKKDLVLEKDNLKKTELNGPVRLETLAGNDPDPGITDLNTKYQADTLFWKKILSQRPNKSFFLEIKSK